LISELGARYHYEISSLSKLARTQDVQILTYIVRNSPANLKSGLSCINNALESKILHKKQKMLPGQTAKLKTLQCN